MKLTKTLAATFTALTFVIVGCEEKKTAVPHDHDGDGVPDHAPGAHPKPVPHDHDGDGVPDHGPGAHPAPVPHDHDGDGVPDHGPGAHPTPVPHDHDGDGKPDHGPGAHDDHSGHDHDAEGHEHAKKVAGPNGGKIITNVEPHAEFFVTADNKVRITFLGDDNKAVAVAAQSVSVVCGDRSKPTKLAFTKAADGKSLISTGALPAGNKFPTIVSVKTTPEADAARAKFTLNLSDCPTCDYKEYACTCDHGHGH